jgi:hypothetical protein
MDGVESCPTASRMSSAALRIAGMESSAAVATSWRASSSSTPTARSPLWSRSRTRASRAGASASGISSISRQCESRSTAQRHLTANFVHVDAHAAPSAAVVADRGSVEHGDELAQPPTRSMRGAWPKRRVSPSCQRTPPRRCDLTCGFGSLRHSGMLCAK